MLIFEKIDEIMAFIDSQLSENKTIGFTPTMGAIHNGHLSLVQKSMLENDISVMSIFVNPTQFNNPADLEKYPRTLAEDIEKIKSVSGKIILFTPSVKEIYGDNLTAQKYDFDGLENEMEGASRPGHFDGVGTIVSKLFDIVRPSRAYFGEKDFQQLQIIKKMVEKSDKDIKVIGCQIFRDENGLAMSSRNALLSPKGLKDAAFIYKTLQEAKELFENNDIRSVKHFVEQQFNNNPLFEFEYFEIADEETLKPSDEKQKDKKYRGFIVASIEGVRLIDNIPLY